MTEEELQKLKETDYEKFLDECQKRLHERVMESIDVYKRLKDR